MDVVVVIVVKSAEDGMVVDSVMADVGCADAAEDAGELGGGVDALFLFYEKFLDAF